MNAIPAPDLLHYVVLGENLLKLAMDTMVTLEIIQSVAQIMKLLLYLSWHVLLKPDNTSSRNTGFQKETVPSTLLSLNLFTEFELICNRAKQDPCDISAYSSFICPRHRYVLGFGYVLGFDWRPPKACGHSIKCSKKIERCASLSITMQLWNMYGKYAFPIGSNICKMHRAPNQVSFNENPGLDVTYPEFDVSTEF